METNFPKNEEKVLAYWKKNRTFEKSINQRPQSRSFVFYEGPPTANGRPGMHHILARAFKDMVCRYKTMQGYRVVRKAGWDTHGLPVELEVEKKLGIKSKLEIEKYGIAKFNKECKESVWQYKKDWEKLTERIGYWVDMKNPYITYENNYIESVWWIIKEIWKKGLLYQDYKVVPYCPRCQTGLSSHEVAQGYKSIKENSIYIKFPVKEEKDTYFLVWTTTPWTLPGNVAIAVNQKVDYVKVKILNSTKEEFIILAKDIFNKGNILDGEIIETIPGKKLLEKEYKPLYEFIKTDKKAYFVVSGDFVSTDEGTGLVHIAPAFGEDDMNVGKKNNLPVFVTVDSEGKFKEEIKQWAGMFVKDAEHKTDDSVIEDLKSRNLLFKAEEYEHDYPFCWRCRSPLLYYARESWFINVKKFNKELIANNNKINWNPSHLKDGRFGEWLREVKDWAVSRERYWGTPLPIWKCECGEKICIGSIKELQDKSKRKLGDLHKPYIDEIVLKCEKCGEKMHRVPEVMDCWFDAGSMPFAQYQYPFKNKDFIDKGKQFPADYICEGIDQTRGWFYTLLVISTIMAKGPAYKNVISVGHILDEKGEKMSKSRGNIVDPWEMINKYGVDCVRWYFYTVNQPGEPKLFSEKDLEGCLKRFLMILLNCFVFYETYANKSKKPKIKVKGMLDKWIMSRLNRMILETTNYLEKYDITSAARAVENFTINDLSQWYIRRSRQRFQRPKSDQELKEVSDILQIVLLSLNKVASPFIPFFSEDIYLKLFNAKKSIHLCDWPKSNKKMIDQKLEQNMEKTRQIVALALAQRAKAGIKVRQPLSKLKVNSIKLEKDLVDLIKEEVNIKDVIFDQNINNQVELDIEITPQLKEEGMLREIMRNIQEMRKNLGLKPKDIILVRFSSSEKIENILVENKKFILSEAKIKDFFQAKETQDKFDAEKDFLIDGEKLKLSIKKN